MVPLCIELNDILQYHLDAVDCVKTFMLNTKEKNLSCHDICKMLTDKFPDFEHWRGRFAEFDHSWLIFKSDPKIILDPYPWACGSGPLLITTNGMTPWNFLYKGVPVEK